MLGAVLALTCALSWSLTVILLKKAGESVDSYALNLGKNCFSLLLLAPTVLIVEGGLAALPAITNQEWILISVSGFLGIGIADALVLRSMAGLSAGHIAILEALFAPFVMFFSYVFLREPLSISLVSGGVLISLAVFLVSPQEETDSGESTPTRGKSITAMIAGLFVMAFGIVYAKPVLNTVPLMWVVFLRMVAGFGSSALVFAFLPDRRQKLRTLLQTPHKGIVFSAFFFGSYIALILWVAGYKYNSAGFAAILNQTSTIFTVILGIVLLKEKVTIPKIIATGLAFAGVVILTLFS